MASYAKALFKLEELGLVKSPRPCAGQQRKGERAIIVGVDSLRRRRLRELCERSPKPKGFGTA